MSLYALPLQLHAAGCLLWSGCAGCWLGDLLLASLDGGAVFVEYVGVAMVAAGLGNWRLAHGVVSSYVSCGLELQFAGLGNWRPTTGLELVGVLCRGGGWPMFIDVVR